MTPESLTQIFNAWGVMIVLAWGILCRRFPGLVNLPRSSITWIGAVLVILQQMAVGVAQAQAPDSVITVASQVTEPSGVMLAALTSAGWAHVFYEALFKALLDRFLPWKVGKKK